jgi:long-chain acyl-CoA synthetase
MSNLASVICDRLDRFADIRPNIAIGGVSAKAFNAMVRQCAQGLVDCGVRPGERVAIVAENSLAYLAAYLGTMLCGAVIVPVNYKLGAETIAFILAETDAKLAFCDEWCSALVHESIAIVPLPHADPAGWAFLASSETLASPAMTAEDHCAILYTSGSTGQPKGVPLTHSGQIWAMEKSFTPIGADADERTCVAAPFYHMNGLFFASVAIANGWTLDLLTRFDAAAYAKAIRTRQYTLLSGVPSMFALLLKELDRADTVTMPSVQTVRIGSAPLAPALLDRVKSVMTNARFYNSYGTTEAGPAIFGPHPDGLPPPPLSIGHPWPDVQWRLRDAAGQLTLQEGVLLLKTPALTPGYLDRLALNQARFIDGWYDTGDIMRRDRDGFFFFVGRADDMFVCGGENLYPGEIEARLERHAEVIQAVVVPVADDIKGAVPVAFVQLTGDAVVTAEDLRRLTLETGPAYAHPRAIIIKNLLPVGTTHKIDRRALATEAEQLMRARGRLT